MHWTLDDLLSLRIDLYEELVAMLNEEHDQQDRELKRLLD